MSTHATEQRNPETAVVGLRYNARTYDGGRGCAVDLRFAQWVNRETADAAGMSRGNPVWAGRKADFDELLSLADFDRIAGVVREAGIRHGGGELDAAGVRAAVALADRRKVERAEAIAAKDAARRAQGPGPDFECLECGATYPPHKAHLIDAGGMGCARCNH